MVEFIDSRNCPCLGMLSSCGTSIPLRTERRENCLLKLHNKENEMERFSFTITSVQVLSVNLTHLILWGREHLVPFFSINNRSSS